MESHQIEKNIIHQLMDHERVIAEFYQVLAGKFPDDAGFWLTIAEEEEGHARLLGKLEEQILSGKLKLVLGTIMKTSLPVSIGKIRQLIAWVKKEDINRKQCIAEAMALEHQLLEEEFYEIVPSDTVWLKEFKIAMRKSIEIHVTRLKDAYKQVTGEDAEHAESEAPVQHEETEPHYVDPVVPAYSPPVSPPVPQAKPEVVEEPAPAAPEVVKTPPPAQPQEPVQEPAPAPAKEVVEKPVSASATVDPVAAVTEEVVKGLKGFTLMQPESHDSSSDMQEAACDLVALYSSVKTSIDDAKESEKVSHTKLEALEPFLVQLEAALKHRDIKPL